MLNEMVLYIKQIPLQRGFKKSELAEAYTFFLL